ncbi:hypothetical protein ACE3NQ_09495 [Paenibacillus terreus]|uniref:Uncharacterized protein n=1 Tax=Paenibacillus terreus TaxID=1387834 RepID=A0ABV5B649_9BACL
MYAQQIERILAKLQQLAQADKEYDIFGADAVYLFYSRELRKAVICFEYT